MKLVAPSGCRAMVETLVANTPAIGFYQSLGFVRSVKPVLGLGGKILNNKQACLYKARRYGWD